MLVKTMFVKSNEQLFNRWKRYGASVTCCKSVIQNSMEISDQEFRDWLRTAYAAQDQLAALITDTVKHVTGKEMP
jgi:hypothetical protein